MKMTCATVLFLVGTVVVQAETLRTTSDACGDSDTNFSVHFQHSPVDNIIRSASDRQATLYIFEQYFPYNKSRVGQPIVRQGIDGKWIGATQGNSYVEAAADPGPHHLCSRLQSHNKKVSSLISLNSFVAEANQSYFFRAQLQNDGALLTLERVSDDEGKRLLSETSKSESTPK